MKKVIIFLTFLFFMFFTLQGTYAFFTNGNEIVSKVTDISVNYKENISYSNSASIKDKLTIYFDNSISLWSTQCISYGTTTNSSTNGVGWPGRRMRLAKPMKDGVLRSGLWVAYTIEGDQLKNIRANNKVIFKINNGAEVQFPSGLSNWFEVIGNSVEIYVSNTGQIVETILKDPEVVSNYQGVTIYYRSTSNTYFYLWNNNGNVANWPGVLQQEVVTVDGTKYQKFKINQSWYDTTKINSSYKCNLIFYFPDTKNQSATIELPLNAKEVYYKGELGKYTLIPELTKYY